MNYVTVGFIVLENSGGRGSELSSNVNRIQRKDEIPFHFKTMLPAIEYRSVIRFLLLRHYDKQAILSELSAAYGDEAPCRATVYKWIQEKETVMEFFNSRSRDFFLEAFQELPTRWSKCVENEGGYIEKK